MQSIKVGASGEVIKQLLGQQEELLRKAIKQNVDEQHGRNVKLFGRAKTGVMRSASQPPPGSSSRASTATLTGGVMARLTSVASRNEFSACSLVTSGSTSPDP